jgi:hypothetical protein
MLFPAVLHAMREDSEKVPSLLTDYILKGTHSLPVTKLLLPFKRPHTAMYILKDAQFL